MEYVIILEHNKKEEETYVLYCQYTGNETEMDKLLKVIETACADDMYGDMAVFETSRVKIPEAAVDIHCSIKDFGSYIHMFQKCEGTFTCPEFSEDPYETAKKLDEYFYHGKLREHFPITKEKLREQRESFMKYLTGKP
jgi:hypothetical protein